MNTIANALDIRMKHDPQRKMADGTYNIYQEIRAVVPFKEHETLWGKEINVLLKFIQENLFKV